MDDLRRAELLAKLILQSPTADNDRYYDELAILARGRESVPELGSELPDAGLEKPVLNILARTLENEGFVDAFLRTIESDDDIRINSLQAVYGDLPNIVRTYEGQQSFKNYVRSTARNIRYDVRIKQERKRAFELELLASGDEQQFVERSHSSNLVRKEVVACALAALAPNLRTVLQLCYIAGLPEKEAAEKMQISVGSLRGLKRRAIRELRLKIGASFYE